MTSLTDKLKAKLAFDPQHTRLVAHKWSSDRPEAHPDGAFINGAKSNNARLAPLHAKLIACVEALETSMLPTGGKCEKALAELKKEVTE